ncbi:uncharacterized protein G2W53_008379 [Senna tora]|uniref:Uncharacterized protein n=1 Tax=Senna tora TaxID=362788 RepID=A0A835CI25_9FABA|nr:uncharacterized protein G2W53_008379 [Senna tora]
MEKKNRPQPQSHSEDKPQK